MMDRSWFAVALFLCLLLVPLVWGAQRLLNTFHPRHDIRRAQHIRLPIGMRLLLLLLLWLAVATVIAALPFSWMLSIQGWTQAALAKHPLLDAARGDPRVKLPDYCCRVPKYMAMGAQMPARG